MATPLLGRVHPVALGASCTRADEPLYLFTYPRYPPTGSAALASISSDKGLAVQFPSDGPGAALRFTAIDAREAPGDEVDCVLFWDAETNSYTLERVAQTIKFVAAAAPLATPESSDEEIRVPSVPPKHLRKTSKGRALIDQPSSPPPVPAPRPAAAAARPASAARKPVLSEQFVSNEDDEDDEDADMFEEVVPAPPVPSTSAIAPPVVQHVPVVPPAPKPAPKRLVIPKIPVPKPNKTSSKAPRRTAPAAGAAIGLPKKRGRKDSTTTPVLPPAPIALKRPVAAGAVSRKAPALSQQHHTAHPPPSSGEDSDEDESSADDDSDDEGAGTGLPEGYLALPPTEMRPAGSFGDDGSEEGSEEDDLDMLASSINSSLAGRPSTPSRKNSLVSSSGRRKSSVSTATQRGTPASKRPAVHDSPSGMGVARDARQGAMSLNRMMGSDAPTPEAKRRLEREADVADSSEEE